MNDELKLWAALYKELAELFTTENDAIEESRLKAQQRIIDAVQWVDLWHNQVGFLQDEHPFHTPAVFFNFRLAGDPEDLSKKAQRLTVQMDVYYFYETFLDTFQGGYNQTDALAYLNTLSDIHTLLHGASGECFSECKRVAFGAVDTGSAGNLYRQSFTMLVEDASASPEDTNARPGDLEIMEGERPIEVVEKAFIVN